VITTSSATPTCYRLPDDNTLLDTRREINESKENPDDPLLWRRNRKKGFDKFGSCKLSYGRLNYADHPGPSKIVEFMKENLYP
jgi:hypothetical protein